MTQSQTSENESFHLKEFFNDQWKIYQKVLNNNYMGHREIYNILHELLVSYFQKPFTMLDLGCGDSSFISKALVNTNIASYHGVDLSITALEIAKKNLAITQCDTTLIPGDFSQLSSLLASGQNNKFDAILISFALHHLHLEQKDYFIEQLQHFLTPGGVFILIDVVRQKEEDRATYIRRYLDDVQQRWSLLSEKEYSMVKEHISSSDFPETQQTLQEISLKSGFTRVECLYQDALNTTQLLCFYKS
ncbi:class I SAM-dependent methyltransferase [Calothrix sp. PCC 7507]|uniref:class I SAM-dependent methyltransferase n=1 Tax=Calothrix sp. PCC 7507 TaxID=99598 RepID=UPI00029EDFA8|nr:class I SAM-dependent methyltransferase [Calothrix sp. PCC 7507]AFY32074.1 Methyltransferase type 12 [Calothrix sp. PCC 7507]